MAPFSPPIVQFRPYSAHFKPSDVYGAGPFTTAPHCITLVIVFRIHGRSNDAGINCFPVTPYPSKKGEKNNLPPDPTIACVLDVNSVSLTIDVIDVCSLNFSHFLMLQTFSLL
jgi:hypothetical protein